MKRLRLQKEQVNLSQKSFIRLTNTPLWRGALHNQKVSETYQQLISLSGNVSLVLKPQILTLKCFIKLGPYSQRIGQRVFVAGRPFKPSLMFVGKARSQEPTLGWNTRKVLHFGRLQSYLQALD